MNDRVLYRWRKMTDEQRAAALAYRRQHRLPWHSPPHYSHESGLYLMTAACFEHRHVIGKTPERLAAFETSLLDTCWTHCENIFVWNVLHNAVRHGYVERWQNWPYCNAPEWLETVGRGEAQRLWKEYPIDDYGAAWDPPNL